MATQCQKIMRFQYAASTASDEALAKTFAMDDLYREAHELADKVDSPSLFVVLYQVVELLKYTKPETIERDAWTLLELASSYGETATGSTQQQELLKKLDSLFHLKSNGVSIPRGDIHGFLWMDSFWYPLSSKLKRMEKYFRNRLKRAMSKDPKVADILVRCVVTSLYYDKLDKPLPRNLCRRKTASDDASEAAVCPLEEKC